MGLVKTTTTRTEKDDDGNRGSSGTRPTVKRAVPFLASLIVAFVILPLVHAGSRLVALFDPLSGALLGQGWTITGAAIAVFAVGIGIHRRRLPLVVWHVAVTAFLTFCSISITTAIGWHYRVWDIVLFFGTLILWLSWMLYRIDSFRAAANGQTDGWGEFIGLARSRPKKIEFSQTHAEIEVAHGEGEHHGDVASSAKKIESAIGAVAGGTTVTMGERADTTIMSFELADAFAHWREWPGPSHPGWSFVYPWRTAYYATGKDQWFSFAATLGYASPHTDFASEMDTFIGAAGLTGSGKSGFLNLLAAEGLSRSDCIVVWLDKEKFLQNASWAADMLGMGGNGEDVDGTPSNATDFVRALRELARYRVGIFGQLALDNIDSEDLADDIGRKWSPELAVETGEAAVLAMVDEADTVVHADEWRWLSARARSLGIFLVPSLPRVSTAEVPAVVRGSVGAWKTYAVGDNYSQGFTLSQATEDAGADPTKFREPGLHYLDRAPGVDPRKWPLKSREFKHTTKQLRKKVKQARTSFTPMGFTRGAIEAMGDFYWRCHPRVILKLETAEALRDRYYAGQPIDGFEPPPEAYTEWEEPPMSPVEVFIRALASGDLDGTPEQVAEAQRIVAANDGPVTAVPVSPAAPVQGKASPVVRPEDRYADVDDDRGNTDREDEDMAASATGTDVGADEVRTVNHLARGTSDPELEAELAKVDPSQPINVGHAGESVRFDEDPEKPRWSPEETAAEMDLAIAGFAERHKMTFTNQELMDAMRCAFSPVTCTRRLHGLAEEERIVPPGLKVEKGDLNGAWMIIRSAPSPRPRQ